MGQVFETRGRKLSGLRVLLVAALLLNVSAAAAQPAPQSLRLGARPIFPECPMWLQTRAQMPIGQGNWVFGNDQGATANLIGMVLDRGYVGCQYTGGVMLAWGKGCIASQPSAWIATGSAFRCRNQVCDVQCAVDAPPAGFKATAPRK